MPLVAVATDPADRLRELASLHEGRIARAFVQVVGFMRGQDLDELSDLIAAGRLEEALDKLEAAGRLLGGAYGEAVVASAQSTAAWLSAEALDVAVAFDGTNLRAVDAIQRNRLDLINGFTAEQRQVVRETMTDGISRGLNPRDQARAFRDTVGLTPRQASAVRNYRRLLEEGSAEALDRQLRDRRFDRSVRGAMSGSRDPLRPEEVDRMVERYSQRYIKHRAEVIGRTEALRSAHQGSDLMYQQAVEEGQLDPRELTREWDASGDSRVREDHVRADGQTVTGLEERFSVGGASMRYPGDPEAPPEQTIQCRCVLLTRLRPLESDE